MSANWPNSDSMTVALTVAHADLRRCLAKLVQAEAPREKAAVEPGMVFTDVAHQEASVDHDYHCAITRHTAVTGDQLELGACK